jgi:hypothetical protein
MCCLINEGTDSEDRGGEKCNSWIRAGIYMFLATLHVSWIRREFCFYLLIDVD